MPDCLGDVLDRGLGDHSEVSRVARSKQCDLSKRDAFLVLDRGQQSVSEVDQVVAAELLGEDPYPGGQ